MFKREIHCGYKVEIDHPVYNLARIPSEIRIEK
jgi:hypothetical protein